jgi:hypothetical protein
MAETDKQLNSHLVCWVQQGAGRGYGVLILNCLFLLALNRYKSELIGGAVLAFSKHSVIQSL